MPSILQRSNELPSLRNVQRVFEVHSETCIVWGVGFWGVGFTQLLRLGVTCQVCGLLFKGSTWV